MSAGLEVEIKLPVADRRAMEERILAHGARPVAGRAFEDNWLFDLDDGRLRADHVMLRLRRVGDQATLTLKHRVDDDSPYKVRRELETAVGDADALHEMLRRIGLVPVYRYQKYRQVFRHDDLTILLDETPLGMFVELEGEAGAIDAFATALGFSRRDYIRDSYRDLQIRARQARGRDGEPAEMIFDEGGSTP